MTTPLPPPDPSMPDDKLPGEAELAARYRQLPQNEPSPALDAAVLRAAAQALRGDEGAPTNQGRASARAPAGRLHARPEPPDAAHAILPYKVPTRAKRPRAPRWLISVASAASLALVAGLAWHMRQLPELERKPAAMADNTRAAPTAPSAVPAGSPAASRDATPLLSGSVRAEAAAPAKADRQPERLSPSGNSIVSDATVQALARDATHGEPAAEQHVAKMRASRRAMPEKRAAATPMQAAPADEPVTMATSPAVAQAAPPAPAAAAPSADRSTAADPADTPDRELAKIRLLAQHHRNAEARQRLQAFQATHPHWELPADLRALLGSP